MSGTATPFELHLQANRTPLGDGYLTTRERHALALYCEGVSPIKIAQRLRIARKTLDSLMRNARTRTGADTNYQLIALYSASDHIRGLGRSSNASNPAPEATVTRAAPSRAL